MQYICDLCHSFPPPAHLTPSQSHAAAEEALANSRGVVDPQAVSHGGNERSSSLHAGAVLLRTHSESFYDRNAGATEGAMDPGGAGWGGSSSVSDAQ